jgi:small-conductance mechanosensitive channel
VPLVALAAGVPRWIARLEPILHFSYWEDVLWAIAATVVAFALGRLVAQVLFLVANRWSRMTATPVDDLVVKHLKDPLRWLLPLFAVEVALSGVELSDAARGAFNHVLVVLTILNIGWLLFRIVHVAEEIVRTRLVVDGTVRADARANYTQLQSFRNIAGFLIALVSTGLALLSFTGVRELGTSVLASAGVVGIVVGFAAQKSIATLVSGLVLAIAQPIRIGDVVVVDGQQGTVEEITLTYVVVRLGDLRRLVLPVGQFLDKSFENWSRVSPEMLGNVLLYVDYTLPVDAMRTELERLLAESPRWNKVSWSLDVVDTTDRTMVVRAQMSADDPSTAWDLRCEIREKLIAFVQSKYPSALPRRRSVDVS